MMRDGSYPEAERPHRCKIGDEVHRHRYDETRIFQAKGNTKTRAYQGLGSDKEFVLIEFTLSRWSLSPPHAFRYRKQ